MRAGEKVNGVSSILPAFPGYCAARTEEGRVRINE